MKAFLKSFSNPAFYRSIQYLKAAFFLSFVYSAISTYFFTQHLPPLRVLSKAVSITSVIMICFSLGIEPLTEQFGKRLPFPLHFQKYFAIFGWGFACVHALVFNASLGLVLSFLIGASFCLEGFKQKNASYLGSIALSLILAHILWVEFQRWTGIFSLLSIPWLLFFMAAYTLRLRLLSRPSLDHSGDHSGFRTSG
jgi:hypothetical protein